MLIRAFEWYRLVNVQPTSQTIDNRAAAARNIMSAIDEAEDWHLALGCAVGVVAGFEGNFTQDSPVVQSLIRAIRAHESAFPQDLSENALELRVCAAVALGEIMVRNGDQAPDTSALLIASVLRSGLGARPSPSSRHLKQMLDELDGAAAKVLVSGAFSRRRRLVALAEGFEKLQELTPTELPAAWKSLVPALTAAMRESAQHSEIDREELNVLWWMFSGVSSTTGRLIAKMPSGAAVLCCGAELGDQCLVPPTLGLEAMVQRAYETGRKPSEMTDRNIEELAADWDPELPNVLVPNEDARRLAQTYPSLFPLSWLCDRLLASKGPTGWTVEFERLTDIPTNHTLLPANWAIQAFRERVAHRVHTKSPGD